MLKTILRPLVIAIACALVVRGAFFRVYAIPSASMAPTLQPGDQIVVTPYRMPFAHTPRRGDVVVFRSPLGRDELLIKRIIATQGDLIATQNGRVTIGGHTIAEPYVQRDGASGVIAPQIVPAGCYFVAGDNREDSWDSRAWGVLPHELVVGRARLVLWSWNGALSEPRANAAPVAASAASATHGRRFLLRIE
ncbi:MAG TPA: signal peptidase I [Thermoanaerobaculia bacterium]|nr:signal peptidase I [Thermoanaerobaculia bacterium]